MLSWSARGDSGFRLDGAAAVPVFDVVNSMKQAVAQFAWILFHGSPRRLSCRLLSCRSCSLLAPALAVVLLGGCSAFQFDDYESFGDWYIGGAGFNKTLSANWKRPQPGDLLFEARPKIYGHFRLFEIIYQPIGGAEFPDRITATADKTRYFKPGHLEVEEDREPTRRRERGDPRNTMAFNTLDGGIVEFVPYRYYSAELPGSQKVARTFVQPGVIFAQVALDLLRAPLYAIHDVVKTLMIPVAAVYY